MSVIGLDIGTSHIKAVSIEKNKDQKKLLRYALVPSKGIANKFFSDAGGPVSDVAKVLKEFLSESGFTDTDVIGLIPEDKVFSKVISMPMLKGDELKKAIQWEAEQHLPNDISETYLKYTVLDGVEDNAPGQSGSKDIKGDVLAKSKELFSNVKKKDRVESDSGQIIEVLLVAAPKKLIDRYLQILVEAGLTPLGIEPISISIIRSVLGEKNPVPTAIVNFGQSRVDFYLATNNTLRFVHTVNFGVASVAKAIARELDISEVQANEYLYAYGLKEDELSGKIREIILPVIDIIVDEIKKAKKYVETRGQFVADSGGQKIRRIIISGGGALIPDIMLYLIQEMNAEVQYANPWKDVEIDHLKNKDLLEELGPLFAGAVGASIKD